MLVIFGMTWHVMHMHRDPSQQELALNVHWTDAIAFDDVRKIVASN